MIRTRRRIFGDLTGNHASLIRGQGYDFEQLRPYIEGDDVRAIDWKATAKAGEPIIRIVREDRRLRVVVVAWLSATLFFGTKRLKQEVLAEAVAAIGQSVVANNDIFHPLLFAEELLVDGGRSNKANHVKRIVESILSWPLQGVMASPARSVDRLMRLIPRRSLVVLLGDFREEQIPDFSMLVAKNEVVAVVVRDHLEENPRYFGFDTLIDPLTQKNYHWGGGAKEYQARLAAHDAKLFAAFAKHDIRAIKLYTDDDVITKLARLWW